MITRLVLDKVTIEVKGLATYPISDFVKGKLEIAFTQYNNACDRLKADYLTSVPTYPTVEKEWFKYCDWAGTYKVVNEFLHGHKEGKKTFPNMSGYIERTRR